MKRDVNVVLVALIVFMMLSTLGLIVYYKITYQNLGKRYSKARNEINDAYKQLDQTRTELERRDTLLREREQKIAEKEELLDQYLEELNLSQQRETSLGDMFNSLKGENQELQEDLTETEGRLTETREELGAMTVNYNKKVEDFNIVRTACVNMDQARAEIDDDVGDIRPAVSAINNANARLDDWVDNIVDETLKDNMERKIEEIDEQVAIINAKLTAIIDQLKDMEDWGDTIQDTK